VCFLLGLTRKINILTDNKVTGTFIYEINFWLKIADVEEI
jgi:hypothetical protein